MSRRRHATQGAPMSFFSFQDIISCVTGLFILVTMLLALELISRTPTGLTRPEVVPDRPDLEDLRRQRDRLKELVEQGRIQLQALEKSVVITPAQLKALSEKVIALEGNLQEVTLNIQRREGEHINFTNEVLKAEQRLAAQTGRIGELRAQIARAANVPKLPFPARSSTGKAAIYVECTGQGITAGSIEQALPQAIRPAFSGAGAAQDFVNWAKTRSRDREYFVFLVRPEAVNAWQVIESWLDGESFEFGVGVWPSSRPPLFSGP